MASANVRRSLPESRACAAEPEGQRRNAHCTVRRNTNGQYGTVILYAVL